MARPRLRTLCGSSRGRKGRAIHVGRGPLRTGASLPRSVTVTIVRAHARGHMRRGVASSRCKEQVERDTLGVGAQLGLHDPLGDTAADRRTGGVCTPQIVRVLQHVRVAQVCACFACLSRCTCECMQCEPARVQTRTWSGGLWPGAHARAYGGGSCIQVTARFRRVNPPPSTVDPDSVPAADRPTHRRT